MGHVNRLAKLRAMPPREVLSRTAYQAYLLYERATYRRGLLAKPHRLRRALVGELQHAGWRQALASRSPQPRFFAGLEFPDRMRALFEERYREERDNARRIADEVARGRIAFFGRAFEFDRSIDWHADPVTGAAWPRHFHADVPVNDGSVGFGDVKDVWEINRHQFFVDLA